MCYLISSLLSIRVVFHPFASFSDCPRGIINVHLWNLSLQPRAFNLSLLAERADTQDHSDFDLWQIGLCKVCFTACEMLALQVSLVTSSLLLSLLSIHGHSKPHFPTINTVLSGVWCDPLDNLHLSRLNLIDGTLDGPKFALLRVKC